MRSCRVVTALVIAVTCPACGEMRDAEPMAKTVPVAGLLAGASLLCGFLLARGVARAVIRSEPGSGSAPDLRHPRLTAALVVLPAAVSGGVAVAGMGWVVAFAYREPHVDIFTWWESVQFAAVVSVGAVALHAAACGVAVAIASDDRHERNAGRIVLGAAVIVLTLSAGGIGLVWLPAIIASSRVRGSRTNRSNDQELEARRAESRPDAAPGVG